MKGVSVTLTVSTHGPTIEEQLEAMQTQLLIDKGIRAAERFERQMREIEHDGHTPLTDDEQTSVLAYLAPHGPDIVAGMSEVDKHACLRNVMESVGYQAWALTGTHDNIVSRTIARERDRILAPIIAEILDDPDSPP